MTIVPPPASIVYTVERFAPGIFGALAALYNDAARGIVEGQVESWYRTPSRNLEVGGDADSQHQLGLAVDSSHARADQAALFAQELRARGFTVVQKVSANTGRHLLHAQAWPAGVARAAGVLQAVGL